MEGAERWTRLSSSFKELWLMKQRGARVMEHTGWVLRVEPGQRKVRAGPSVPNEGMDL